MNITLNQAEKIILGAKEKATILNTKMNISVVDSGANLVTFAGGIPIHNSEGNIIGAIGVSGSSVTNEKAVAEAEIIAIENLYKVEN